MIYSVRISGYRAFTQFEMGGLGRVNLLVGRNNTGKTSVLEALYLLTSRGDPNALWRIMSRRGEQIAFDPTTSRNPQQELDVCHLFHGHGLQVGAAATITTKNEIPEREVSFNLTEAKREGNEALYAQMPADDGIVGQRISLSITGNPDPVAPLIPLSSRGGVRPEMIQVLNSMAINAKKIELTLPQYVTTESTSWAETVNNWNTISLGPHQERVLNALRVIEPRIEGIAPAPVGNPFQQIGAFYAAYIMRGGLKVKLANQIDTVPIGSLGEGIWRMLALATVLARAKDSLLLVDEIDTGLHYTVMEDMWKMIYSAAKDLNIQVFATTHSFDCIHSLATICVDTPDEKDAITIQRIETNKSRAVAFTHAQVRMVAEREIEVR